MINQLTPTNADLEETPGTKEDHSLKPGPSNADNKLEMEKGEKRHWKVKAKNSKVYTHHCHIIVLILF